MSVSGKRWWTPRQDFQGAYGDTLQFLQRCKEKNVISSVDPALFYAYRTDGIWPVEGLQDSSRYMRFGSDKNPAIDEVRQTLARLLSIAIKAHFFLNDQAIVLHEPYLFSVPDLNQAGRSRHGLVYPIEEKRGNSTIQRTIVVSEWDLTLDASNQPRIPNQDRFPVVLSSDPFRWLNLKHWRSLKLESAKQPWFENSSDRERKAFMAQIQAHTDPATFSWGTVLNYEIGLREDVKQVGAMWAKGIKKWFLPTGWDAPAVIEYLDRLQAMSDSERYNLRWWTERPRPNLSRLSNVDKK